MGFCDSCESKRLEKWLSKELEMFPDTMFIAKEKHFCGQYMEYRWKIFFVSKILAKKNIFRQ
jgi:hypothetical protein